MSTATELKKANEMTNFKKYKAKVYEALAKDTYGLTISQLATVYKLSAKTIKQILAELDVEKNGDVYLLKIKQPIPSTPQFPIYDSWLSKNMATLRQATAHLSKNDVNDLIEVAGRIIWEASKNQTVPEGYVLVTEDQAKDTARLDFMLDDSTKRTVCHQKHWSDDGDLLKEGQCVAEIYYISGWDYLYESIAETKRKAIDKAIFESESGAEQ
ncbi:hypothetical protein [Acinetobacter calcoaceticus]|uniref:Uncharacterized protein n=1 Tax=Acinetobacter calcoaceticus TaxID=471 RepID=A0ABD5AL92_ACICA|nr:hypothetical protein [Acinetobacter calcoaceticus]MDP9803262.1 hypothetical protein [Acinetobacter calcoaceticus]